MAEQKTDEYYMEQALVQAKLAYEKDEVPIGCVIVKDDKVIAKSHNLRESTNDPCGHAEILAIRKASKKLNSWRLENCDIYITVEPCIMCMGAIIQSRIETVIYGTEDYKGGALGSSINVLDAKGINHHPNVISGVMKKECSEILTNYFKTKRNK